MNWIAIVLTGLLAAVVLFVAGSAFFAWAAYTTLMRRVRRPTDRSDS